MKSAQKTSREVITGPATHRTPDHASAAIPQGALQEMIGSSPRMVAQGKRLAQLQSKTEDEELAKQGKFPAQRLPEEEDEPKQGTFAAQGKMPEEEELTQGKFSAQMAPQEEEEPLQGRFPAQFKPSGGIPDGLRSGMERGLGSDFSDVRVHPDSGKATEVGALAYTQGNDIHFAPGQFSPDTSAGRQLLGHELAHVVQQREGRVSPTTEVAGIPVNNDPSLESEADRLGSKAAG